MRTLPLNVSANTILDSSGNGTASTGPLSPGEIWDSLIAAVRAAPVAPAGAQVAATGSGTSLAAFTTICTSPVLAAGLYTVGWSVTLSGTLASADVNNLRLVQINPLLFLAESVNPAAAGTYPQAPFTVSIPQGASLIISSGPSNATSGAVYSAAIANPGAEAIGSVYAGADKTAGYFRGATTWGSTGDSTDNLPEVRVGGQVFAVWTGGDPGALATLTVTGTRTVR